MSPNRVSDCYYRDPFNHVNGCIVVVGASVSSVSTLKISSIQVRCIVTPADFFMPARDQHFRCFCSVCCEVGDDGVANNPAGKPQLERFKHIHLRKLAHPYHEPVSDLHRAAVSDIAGQVISSADPSSVPSPERPTPQPDIEALSAALLAATLSDKGPDLDSQPSKLWASRQEYQTQRAAHGNNDFPLPDVGDLVSAIGRISLANMYVPCQIFLMSILIFGLRQRTSFSSDIRKPFDNASHKTYQFCLCKFVPT
jgi:hypothetical protein